MIKCSTNKKVYLTEALAEEALIGAHTIYNYAGKGPVTVYSCENCGYFHLTSKGAMNVQLKKRLDDGSIHRMREANAWEKKLKH